MEKIMRKLLPVLILVLVITFTGNANLLAYELVDDSVDVQVNNNVQLVMASSRVNNYRFRYLNKRFLVKVKNLGFSKTVSVHHKMADGSWKDYAGFFKSSIDDQTELWEVVINTSNVSSMADQFAIKYEVNGQIYWDNNNNNNYYLAADDGVMLAGDINILQYYASAYTHYSDQTKGSFYGSVYLKNLAFNKTVTVIYTTDNWATIQTKTLTYQSGPNKNNIEQWGFSIELALDANVTEIEYAYSYEVNGVTYWDNNFGANYKIEIQ